MGARISKDLRPSVLVIAHDISKTGGVNNFLRIMRKRIRPRVQATRFINGRRINEGSLWSKIKRLVSDYIRFAGLLRQKNFDVLHINPSFDMSSLPRELIFVWICRFISPKTQIIIFYRGWDWSAVEHLRKSRLVRALFVATQQKAQRIFVLADSFRDALGELGVRNVPIRLMSTMFEGEVLAPTLSLGLERHDSQMLFLSRFIAAKRGDSVIRALGLLASRYPDARLIMAGDGPDRPALEALTHELGLTDRVTYTGYVGGERKMRLLAQSSLFLLPTEHPEGMPNAILEAMAAGEVIITTPVGGIPSIVRDGDNGVILEATDAETLAAAIEPYLADPELSRAVGAHNSEIAWKTWESAIVSNRIADEYLALVHGDHSLPAATIATASSA